jgi:hypothetical protein
MINSRQSPKFGFLSALALSLALAGFGCDSDKKSSVVDAAADHVSTDSLEPSDSDTESDAAVGKADAGRVDASDEDARLTDDGAPVVKDAPISIVDAPADLAVASDSSAD